MNNETISSNKFGLNLETVFSFTGGQRNSWTTLSVPVRIDTMKRLNIFTLSNQNTVNITFAQPSEHLF
jgi:hypothetical protein